MDASVYPFLGMAHFRAAARTFGAPTAGGHVMRGHVIAAWRRGGLAATAARHGQGGMAQGAAGLLPPLRSFQSLDLGVCIQNGVMAMMLRRFPAAHGRNPPSGSDEKSGISS